MSPLKTRVTSVAAAVAFISAGSFASAQVQYGFQKANSFNLSTLFNGTSGYGNSPLSVTADNAGNVYLGGYNSTGTDGSVGIVKFTGILSGTATGAGLSGTQYTATTGRGIDALASVGGDVYQLSDTGTASTSFISRFTSTGTNVWQHLDPGGGARVSAMSIDPVADTSGATPAPEVAFIGFNQGRRASLRIADGSSDFTFSNASDASKFGAIVNPAPTLPAASNWRSMNFDSTGQIILGSEQGVGVGARVSANQFSTLDGATPNATSRVELKSPGLNNVGNGTTFIQGAATDELIAFSPRVSGSGAGGSATLTDGTGGTTTVTSSNIQLRLLKGQTGYLSQSQLTGGEDGLGSAYAGEIKNFATGTDAAGNPVLYVVDYITRQLDVYTIEPKFVAAGGSYSNPANWLLGIVPNSRVTNATFTGATTATPITLDAAKTVKQLKFSGTGSYTINGTAAFTLQAPANDSLNAYVTDLAGNHTVNAPIILASNTRIDVTNAADTITLGTVDGATQNLQKRLPGTAAVTHVRVATLAVDQGALTFKPNGAESGVSRITSLTLGTTPTVGDPTVGTINLTNNGLIYDYDAATGTSQASNFAAAVSLGLITSNPVDASHVLAIVDYTDSPTAALPTFSAGSGLTIDRTSTFIRYTFKGDANLSGAVDFDDLLILAKSYGAASGASLGTGDADGNGTVDFNDLLLLAKNYNKSVATNGAAADSATFQTDWKLAQSLVPEPTTLGLLAGMSLSMVRRRRA